MCASIPKTQNSFCSEVKGKLVTMSLEAILAIFFVQSSIFKNPCLHQNRVEFMIVEFNKFDYMLFPSLRWHQGPKHKATNFGDFSPSKGRDLQTHQSCSLASIMGCGSSKAVAVSNVDVDHDCDVHGVELFVVVNGGSLKGVVIAHDVGDDVAAFAGTVVVLQLLLLLLWL